MPEILYPTMAKAIAEASKIYSGTTPTFRSEEEQMKICTRCGKTKRNAEFYKVRRNSSARRSWCKDCMKSLNKPSVTMMVAKTKKTPAKLVKSTIYVCPHCGEVVDI